LTPVAEEPLERPRQATVAVGEVRPQGLLERKGSPFVRRLRLLEERLELAPDDIDVHRHAGILEGDEADLQGSFDESRSIVHRPLGDERGEGGVDEGQAIDDDPVTLEPDDRRRRNGRRREGDEAGFHGAIFDAARAT